MKIQNPVLRGFYPDPSVCEANGKYYLCNSTFQYLPGAPIFESEDLVNWHQITNCLTSPKQIALHKVYSSGGMFAPTLRFHEGVFYMVTNNNSFGKNFYVYTDDLSKQWSEPVFVDQDGIDPSLLFDDDGKVYFTSNGDDEYGAAIRQCEIDIKTGKKLSETKVIWRGSGGRYIESPHLYHIGDWYYLMIAEGGTEYGHMVTYARAKNPYGPFEGYAKNPVLTNRNLGGHQSRIQGIGHGDLIKDKKGNYYMLCLGFRQSGTWEPFHHLGREVFLVPVSFDAQGWFTAGENGIVKEWMEMDIDTVQKSKGQYDFCFETKNPLKDLHWMYLRDYVKDNYAFDEERKVLILNGTKLGLNDCDTPTFVGFRQSEFEMNMQVLVSGEANEAGLTVYMDENQHYDLVRYRDEETDETERIKVALRVRIGDAEEIKDEVFLTEGSLAQLMIRSTESHYYFYVVVDGQEICLGSARTKYLSSEVAGGFTGVMLAMFAVDGKAEFSDFRLVQKH